MTLDLDPDPLSAAPTIQLWADVGGTFTDCFLVDPAGTRVAKVLSSGITRATLSRCLAPRSWQLKAPPDGNVDGFWNGARVAVVESNQRTGSIGLVEHYQSAPGVLHLRAEDHLPTRQPSPPSVIELDAGLEAPVLAAHMLLGIPLDQPLPPLDVRLGTTRGTNALLTRRGADTALLVTAGFADILRIGEQNRPQLFTLAIDKPAALAQQVIEVHERLDSTGKVLQAIDLGRLEKDLLELQKRGVQSLSICLLHAHVNDHHEQQALQIAHRVGFSEVSLSSEVAPLIKLVSRAETTTLDAYLNPILSGYVAKVWKQFGGPSRCRLRWMTSGGNLVAPQGFRGRDCILSGPAGGVVALAKVAQQVGVQSAIGLDMGGTSTDVSRYEGRLGRRYESQVAGVRVLTPMMDIHTVAAGGGSICGFRNGRLHVGPQSAGADPGPACYGRGGPLTITDVNLYLGRIPADRFPLPLDRQAVVDRLDEVFNQAAAAGHC
ncbi:MAG: 5-oxoprolinase, partial [Pirellulales bacterium]|nr:5-oxoprolinase [Pirellulales bacterium]